MAAKLVLLGCLAWLGVECVLAAGHSVKLGVLVPDNMFLRRRYKSTAFRTVSSAQRDLASPDFSLQVGLGFVDANDVLVDGYCGLVDDQGAQAMLVVRTGDPQQDDKVEEVASRLHVPTIVYNNDGYTPALGSSAPVLYLMPTLRQQLAAMVDFLQSYGWQDYVIMSEYPAASFRDVNVSVVQFDKDTIGQGLSRVRQVLSTSPYKTKVILLFANGRLAEQVFEEASEEMLDPAHVWLLSAAAVDTSSTGEFPVGVFGFDFGEEDESDQVKDAMQAGISVWYSGIKEAVKEAPELLSDDVSANCEDGSVSSTGAAFFRLMANNAPDGFNHLGEPLGAQLAVVNLRIQGQWSKMGSWTPQGGLEMDLPVFLGGAAEPPAPHA